MQCNPLRICMPQQHQLALLHLQTNKEATDAVKDQLDGIPFNATDINDSLESDLGRLSMIILTG